MRLYIVLAAAALSAAAVAEPIGEIVWPEYAEAAKPYDAQLTCPKLKAEIDHVDADLTLLRRAQIKAEEATRMVREMRSPTGGALADTSSIRTGGKGVEYAEVRSQIKESRRIAMQRYDHLMELLPSCKEPATP
jgi:hypothetical protein